MSSYTDSSSSSESSSERRRKTQKKMKSDKASKKHKKDKKKKSRKEKKRSRKEYEKSELKIKPATESKRFASVPNKGNEDPFGPALPPHLINNENNSNPTLVIGPTMPDCIEQYTQNKDNEASIVFEKQILDTSLNEDHLVGSYGPLPIVNESEMSTEQIELEKRALALKMAAIDGTSTNSVDQKVREEWMLELPDVGLKSGLAALNNIKRGFYQGKERPDFSDRSSWTKTPQSCDERQNNPEISKAPKEDLQSQALALYEKQRDAEQEGLARKHKKKHKRDESLLDIHQKKLRKEEKRKAKELKESGMKPERRPFSRDIDLKLNKIDSNQTKQIVDKAKILNTKFSSGRAKYL